MEMGNVSKRQQTDHRKNNSRRSPTGLNMARNSREVYIMFQDAFLGTFLTFKSIFN